MNVVTTNVLHLEIPNIQYTTQYENIIVIIYWTKILHTLLRVAIISKKTLKNPNMFLINLTFLSFSSSNLLFPVPFQWGIDWGIFYYHTWLQVILLNIWSWFNHRLSLMSFWIIFVYIVRKLKVNIFHVLRDPYSVTRSKCSIWNKYFSCSLNSIFVHKKRMI